MNKIDRLIEEHQCEIRLTPVPPAEGLPARMRVAYAYTWGEADCLFSLGSEIAESLVPAFQRLLDRRGLLITYPLELTKPPWLADLVRPDPDTPAGRRWLSLMPDMIPRWLRVYDNSGRSIDRYTAVFTGRAPVMRLPGAASQYPYLAMSDQPFHPQGFGQHGFTYNAPCDAQDGKWAPAIGRKNHLGTRINFRDLPDDCQRCVLQNYLPIWKL